MSNDNQAMGYVRFHESRVISPKLVSEVGLSLRLDVWLVLDV